MHCNFEREIMKVFSIDILFICDHVPKHREGKQIVNGKKNWRINTIFKINEINIDKESNIVRRE